MTAPLEPVGPSGDLAPSLDAQCLVKKDIPASLQIEAPLPPLPVLNNDLGVEPLQALTVLRTQLQLQIKQLQTKVELTTGWIKVKDIERMTAELKLEKLKKDAAAKSNHRPAEQVRTAWAMCFASSLIVHNGICYTGC